MQLLHGDCLELLRNVPDESVDLVLTDPPYSSGGLFAGDRKQDTRIKYTNVKHNGAARMPSFTGDNMDQRALTAFLGLVFASLRHAMQPGAVCASFIDWRNLPAMTDALQVGGLIWRGIVVWDKGATRNQPGRYRQDCEFVVWGTNGPRGIDWTPGFRALPGCYRVPGVSSKSRHHQTEKPVSLLEQLIQIVPEGGTVLDPFMGSGSTGVACVKTGRDFIGIELDEHYYNVARMRVLDAQLQQTVAKE